MNHRLTTLRNRIRSRTVARRITIILGDDLDRMLKQHTADGTPEAQWVREAIVAKATRAEVLTEVLEELRALRRRLDALEQRSQ
jgi:hypothetical protein